MNGEEEEPKEVLVTKLLALVNKARDKDQPPIKPSNFTHEQALNILRQMVYSSESKEITFLYDNIMPREKIDWPTTFSLWGHRARRTLNYKWSIYRSKLALVKKAFASTKKSLSEEDPEKDTHDNNNNK